MIIPDHSDGWTSNGHWCSSWTRHYCTTKENVGILAKVGSCKQESTKIDYYLPENLQCPWSECIMVIIVRFYVFPDTLSWHCIILVHGVLPCMTLYSAQWCCHSSTTVDYIMGRSLLNVIGHMGVAQVEPSTTLKLSIPTLKQTYCVLVEDTHAVTGILMYGWPLARAMYD